MLFILQCAQKTQVPRSLLVLILLARVFKACFACTLYIVQKASLRNSTDASAHFPTMRTNQCAFYNREIVQNLRKFSLNPVEPSMTKEFCIPVRICLLLVTLVQQQYKCGISQHPRLLTLSAEALTKVVLIDNVRLPTNPNLGTVTKTDNGPLYFSVCCPRGIMEPRTWGSLVRILADKNRILILSGS